VHFYTGGRSLYGFLLVFRLFLHSTRPDRAATSVTGFATQRDSIALETSTRVALRDRTGAQPDQTVRNWGQSIEKSAQ
jgi:hypothetical protein